MALVYLSIAFLYLKKNLVLINLTEGWTIPACPSLMCFVNKGNIKETVSSKIQFFGVCACMF